MKTIVICSADWIPFRLRTRSRLNRAFRLLSSITANGTARNWISPRPAPCARRPAPDIDIREIGRHLTGIGADRRFGLPDGTMPKRR